MNVLHQSAREVFLRYLRTITRSRGFLGGSVVMNLPAIVGDVGSIPSKEDPLEKKMATHCSILA